MPKKIAFFEVEPWEKEYLRQKLCGYKLFFSVKKLQLEDKKNFHDAEAISIFINSPLGKKELAALPKLKFIATMSTGFDHINVDYCKKRKIKVSNVPSYGENTVAEHTFGLILTLSRKLDDSIERTKEDNFSLEGLMGFDLRGKTLGVVGAGRIGQHVIKIAKGFEMNVICYSKEDLSKLSKDLGFLSVSFLELLKKSDIITFHVPLTKETEHMINMKNVNKIKKGGYIINTARGGIIETAALSYGLENGIIAGAGLDVLEGEDDMKEHKSLLYNYDKKAIDNFVRNHLLLKEKNVVITPHSAFYTREALQRILDTTIENVNSFSKGKVLNNVY